MGISQAALADIDRRALTTSGVPRVAMPNSEDMKNSNQTVNNINNYENFN